jgi:diaminohydroxyphosphoribosylaminopyrimidine deaminase/5-amino-6-(5-phosphoribosylamino)uracil reductase
MGDVVWNQSVHWPRKTLVQRSSTLLPDETTLRKLLAELSAEARQHRFDVAPNPTVGAAVLSGSNVISRGYHRVFGEAHAEVDAIEAARKQGVPPSEWDLLVVTLEPCSSVGKTPACTDLILASGIRRVVVGQLDPDPRHQGGGIELLRSHGIEVELFEGASLDAHFVRWIERERLRRPRPWTIAKWAQTRTGQLTPPADVGEGRWISGPDSLAEVQRLRGRVDAIVTGVSTVLADDPRFSVRSPGDPTHPPLRVVLDSHLRTRPDGRLFEPPGPDEGAGAVALLCHAGLPASAAARKRELDEVGAEVVGMPLDEEGLVSLRDVQTWLWDRGVRRVMLEAGPKLVSRSLELGFVDQLRVYTGAVNGGRGKSMAEWFTRLELQERLDREVGEDSVLEAFLKPA